MLRSFRSVLALPGAYQLWWNMVGGPGWARVLVDEYIQPVDGMRVLDIGCGPGTILPYLSRTDYLGFDFSPGYVELAKKRYPHAQFVCERVNKFALSGRGNFDIVLALGVVHHLDDAEARQLFEIAYDALKPGGKLVTVDGVFADGQSPTARWLLARDRGEYVRNEREYVSIAAKVFVNVRRGIRHDLLRIPYSHLILQCVR